MCTSCKNNHRGKCEGKKEREKKEKQNKMIKESKKAAEERFHGVKIEMHPVHQVWCEDEKEDKYTEKVRNFLC